MICKLLPELLAEYSLKQTDIPTVQISGIQIDSRRVKLGDLFVAYPGQVTDGRHFIKEAVDSGAAAILYESMEKDSLDSLSRDAMDSFDCPLIPISGLSSKVSDIAAGFYGYPARQLKVIGVTGTNGKTSCVQFITQSLSQQKYICGIMGTLGYGFLEDFEKPNETTPSPVDCQRLLHKMKEKKATHVAMEVSSHALDQDRVTGIDFDIGVFTQLSRDHLDYHGSMKNYANAKKRLFSVLNTRAGVVNLDDELGYQIIRENYHRLEMVGYTINNKQLKSPITGLSNIIQATQIYNHRNEGIMLHINSPWGSGVVFAPLLGHFNASNLLAVLGVLFLNGVSFDAAQLACQHLTMPAGRMETLRFTDKPMTVIDYSHTPDSLQKVLIALRYYCKQGGRIICVFGCGGDRDHGKRAQMGAIAEKYADIIVLTNDNPRSEDPMRIIKDITNGIKKHNALIIETDREKAIHYAIKQAQSKDLVLIAGKGHETTQHIGNQINYFNDKEIAIQVLKR